MEWSNTTNVRRLLALGRTSMNRLKTGMLVTLLAPVGLFAADDQRATDFKKQVAPYFEQHCIRCHGPEKSKGKITLHTLDAEMELEQDLKHWEEILDVIASGEMPPEDEEQPQEAASQAVTNWIDAGLKAFVKKAGKQSSDPVVRRLTNFEYQNTMTDLLGVEMDYVKDLPADPDKPYHFNNTAFYMMLGMEQIDLYEQTARRALSSIIVEGDRPESFKQKSKIWSTERPDPTKLVVKTKKGEKRLSPLAPAEIAFVTGVNKHGKLQIKDGIPIKRLPYTGTFRLRFKLSARFTEPYDELPFRIIMGYTQDYDRKELPYKEVFSTILTKAKNSDARIFEVTGRLEDLPRPAPSPSKRRDKKTGKVRGSGGMTASTVMLYPQNLFDDGTLCDKPALISKPTALFEWVEVEAPVADVWPPAHHRQIFFESPLRQSNPDAYAADVIKAFMTRAFRRPVADEEVSEYLEIYKTAAKTLPTMESAMIETLTMVLISPDFLYHVAPTQADPYYEHHLASKLSYFLWGTMPDESLIGLAEESKLQDKSVIESQVTRMLADEKSKRFVDNFSRQWLSLDKSKTIPVNFKLFPRFSYRSTYRERSKTHEKAGYVTIRDDMIEETVSFVGELIKRNASVTNLIDSDFAMLNARLAHHYGVEGVSHARIKSVKIEPKHRLGGVLTHGSVLIGNSTGTAPHPIYRAVWLREAILGDEVKDPPSDVPALVDSVGEKANTSNSIKKLMEIHREKESCNDCHVRLDPWGIPFERYNAVGQYQPKVPKDGVVVEPLRMPASKNKPAMRRSMKTYLAYLDSVFTEDVEAQARVPHGPEVNGMPDLKRHLIKSRADDVAENVIRRLSAYAIGRKLTYHDRYVIEQLLTESKDNNYQMQDMIVSICQSALFLGKGDSNE